MYVSFKFCTSGPANMHVPMIKNGIYVCVKKTVQFKLCMNNTNIHGFMLIVYTENSVLYKYVCLYIELIIHKCNSSTEIVG